MLPGARRAASTLGEITSKLPRQPGSAGLPLIAAAADKACG
jgi:hypothetical protein